MRHRGLLLVVVLGLLLGLGSSVLAAGGYHQDDRIGYKIRVPKKWETVALKTNEKWLDEKFISKKQYKGQTIRALERPGLWNGAMAGWNTAFIEVPLATFTPVKTVLDLLRPEHQTAKKRPA